MASAAIGATGALLKIGDGTSTPTYTQVPEVIDINCPEAKPDYLETSSHDSPGAVKEWITGMFDGGTLPFKLNWLPTNTTHQLLRTNQFAGIRTQFTLTLANALTLNKVTFLAYIEVTVAVNKGAVLMGTGSLRVTGLPAWS